MDDLGYSPVSDDSDKLKEGRKRSRRSDETVENSNLFVNFIPPEYKEADLERMFSPFGTIISTKLMIDLRTHESKCFGFVKFATIDAARSAINALHDTKLTERRLVVKYAEPKGGSATPFGTPSCNIFIKNLPLSVTEDQISEELSKFGTISKCELYRGERGDSLGRATITYESQHAAAKAIDVLNDVPFPGDPNGERLKVRYEDTDHERETRLLKMKRRRMLSHKGGPPSPPHESFRGRRDDVRDDRGSHHRSSSEDSRHRYSSSHESRDRYSEHPSSQSRGYNDQDRFSDNRMPPRDSRWSAESSSYHSNDRDRERYEPHPSDRDRKRFAEPPPRDTHRDRFGPPQSTEREPTRFPEEDKRYMNEQPSRYYPDKDIRDFRDERSSFRGPPEIDNRPPFDRYGPPERDRFRPRDPETERFRGRDPEPLPPREERPREIIRDDRDRMMHRQDKDLDRGSYRDERDKRDFRDDRSRGIDGSRERAIARDRHAEDTQREINPDSNLFVYNLPSSYTDNDLYKLFREFGPIASVRVMTEPVSNQCKGFGFVEMATSEAASQAIQKMHGSKLYGKELQVSLKKDKPR